MAKFKIGDKVKGVSWWSGTKHTGTIIEIDEDDIAMTYKIKSETHGTPWLLNDTVEKIEGEEMAKFKIGDVVKVKGIWTHLSGLNYKIANINESDTRGMYHLQTLEDNRTLFPSGIKYNEPDIYFWDQASIEDGFELVEGEEMNKYEKLLKFVRENELSIDDLNDVAENLDELENLEFEIKDTKDLIEETEEELERLYEELSELEDERNELLK